MAVDLFYKKQGSGPPLFILHGLFGSGDNWQTIANKLEDRFTVYLIDMRNHGQSPHTNKHNYAQMAADLLLLCEKEKLQKISIIGHSMGGKAAMKFAVINPTMVNKLVVVDIAPKQYPVHHQQILEAFNSIDLQKIQSRNEAFEQMGTVFTDTAVRQFLLKNLIRNDVGFSWKINLTTLQNEIENIGEPLNSDEIFDGDTLFVSGQKSGYIVAEDVELIQHHFPNSKTVKINCGHWVHAEAPNEFLGFLDGFIQ